MSKSVSYGLKTASLVTVILMVVSGFGSFGTAEDTSTAVSAPGFEDLLGQMMEEGEFTAEDVRELQSESEDGSEYTILDTDAGEFVVIRIEFLV